MQTYVIKTHDEKINPGHGERFLAQSWPSVIPTWNTMVLQLGNQPCVLPWPRPHRESVMNYRSTIRSMFFKPRPTETSGKTVVSVCVSAGKSKWLQVFKTEGMSRRGLSTQVER